MTEEQNSGDEEGIEQAKVAMAGPLGRELSAFPIRFAEPIYFGEPSADHDSDLNNGTATIVDLGCGVLAVTCSHVLAKYRERLASSADTTFQIGNLKVDALARLQSEDIDIDLAVINLDGCDLEQMSEGKVVESGVFRPTRWPPHALQPDDFIAVGGFPGVWRNRVGQTNIVYDSFSLGATRVTTVHLDYFICQGEGRPLALFPDGRGRVRSDVYPHTADVKFPRRRHVPTRRRSDTHLECHGTDDPALERIGE